MINNLLPVVNPDVGHSVAESIGDEDQEYIIKEIKKLKKKNPAIADFIKKWCKGSKCTTHSALCGILVYNLLESQAEVNLMEISLNI